MSDVKFGVLIMILVLVFAALFFGFLIATSGPIDPILECPDGMVKVEKLKIEGHQWVHCKDP